MIRIFTLICALSLASCTLGDDVTLFNATSTAIVISYAPDGPPSETIRPGRSARVSYKNAQRNGVTGLRVSAGSSTWFYPVYPGDHALARIPTTYREKHFWGVTLNATITASGLIYLSLPGADPSRAMSVPQPSGFPLRPQ